MVYQIKSNQIKLRMDAANKRILQFEANSFVNESKKLLEVRSQHRTSQRDKEEEQDNKQNKVQKRNRATSEVQEHYS